MGISTAPGAMTGEEIVELTQAPHDLRVVGAGQGRPDPGGGRQGLLLLDARRQALPRLQQPADVREHRPRRSSASSRPSQEQAATLAYANPFMATEPRARLGAKLAEITPGDIDTFFFTNGGAEANENAIKLARDVHRPPEDRSRATASYHGATGRGDHAHRRSAPLGRRAGHPGRRPRPRLPPLGPARTRSRSSEVLRDIEEVIMYEGPQTIAGDHRGDGRRHQRHPHPARRLHAGRPRDLRPLRHPARSPTR